MHLLKHLMLLCGIVALLLVMVSCGGDDGGDDNDDESPATSTSTGGAAATTSSDDDEGGGDADDPCSLLTLAEIEAAVGMSVSEGSVDETGTCKWAVGPADEFKAVYLGVESVELYDGVRPSDGVTDVSDVGDTAYWVSGLSTLWVRDGETVIAVQVVTLAAGDAPMESAKVMALAALDRL